MSEVGFFFVYPFFDYSNRTYLLFHIYNFGFFTRIIARCSSTCKNFNFITLIYCISRRLAPKLYIDRNRMNKSASPGPNSSDLSAELFLTPNSTLSETPETDTVRPKPLLLLQTSADDALFVTPDATINSPICNNYHNRNGPSYFDRKKQDIITLAKSAANVLPLNNFQLFKQKSLNTLPNLRDKPHVKESKEHDSTFFHNFPFLTPLANRKNSIHDRNRLSSCTEDEFYVTLENDVDFRSPTRNAISMNEKLALSPVVNRQNNKIKGLDKNLTDFTHSTPKYNTKDSDKRNNNINQCVIENFEEVSRKKHSFNVPAKVNQLATSKSTTMVRNNTNNFNSINPLRHSYTAHYITEGKVLTNKKISDGGQQERYV